MNKKLRSKYARCLFKSIDIKNLLLYSVFPKLKNYLSNELIFCEENMSKAVRNNNLKTLKQQANQFFVQNKYLSVFVCLLAHNKFENVLTDIVKCYVFMYFENSKTLKNKNPFLEQKYVCYDEFAYVDILCCWQKQKDCDF